MPPPRPLGFWMLIIGGAVFSCAFIAGQTLSLIDYERTVAWGLQEPGHAIGITGRAYNFGFAFADTVFYVPVLAVGLWGLWSRKAWARVVMAAALGISVYWPVVCTAALMFGQGQPGFGYAAPEAYLALTLPSLVYGLWGLWYVHNRRADLFP